MRITCRRGTRRELFLYYFDFHRGGSMTFRCRNGRFTAAMIDPLEMTVTAVPGTFTGKSKMTLTGKPYMAVLFQKARCDSEVRGGGAGRDGRDGSGWALMKSRCCCMAVLGVRSRLSVAGAAPR